MMYHAFPLATVLLLFGSGAGCAPVPRTDDKAGAKPFLDELKFVDQDSINVVHYKKHDRDDGRTLVFSTKSVDFNHPDKLDLVERLPSAGMVSVIEKISTYRFQKPSEQYSSLMMALPKLKNGRMTFDIIKDGELYIVYCAYDVAPDSTVDTKK